VVTAVEPGAACTIHVGLPKTGTSTLQTGLFSRHSGLLYLGKNLTSRKEERYEPGLTKLIRPILQADGATLAAADAQAWARARMRESRDCGKALVLSNEGIISPPARMRERWAVLQDLFGPCRAIITLREPVALIEALYFQIMLRRRLLLVPPTGRRQGYWIPIEEWLDRLWARPDKGALGNLGYAATAQFLAEASGRENVGIVLMEQLREDPAAYYRSICRFLGVDEEEGVRVASGFHANPRPTRAEYEAFREASRSWVGRFVLRWGPLASRKKLRRRIRRAEGSAERPEARMPARWVEKIGDLTRPGNDAIMRDWGLPLDRYGYSVT
jgi:hypothetical protein